MATAKKTDTSSSSPPDAAANRAVSLPNAQEQAPIKRGRGRPYTGDAKSSAERKQLQRTRDQKRAIEEQTLETLITSARTYVVEGNISELKVINKEMLRRAKLNAVA